MKKLFSVFFISALLLAGCSSSPTDSSSQVGSIRGISKTSDQTTQSVDQSSTGTTTDNSTNTSSTNSMTTTKDQFNQLAPPQKGDTIATLETDYGTIKFKLFTKQAPEITKNFIELAKAGKYTNVPFHRVIQDFMIQTGDFENGNGTGGYSYKGPGTELNDEISTDLVHDQYTVSMANKGPNTNGSQFFIVSAKNGAHWLDGSYSIFGQVYEGMDVVDKIEKVQTDSNDRPLKAINLKSVTISTY